MVEEGERQVEEGEIVGGGGGRSEDGEREMVTCHKLENTWIIWFDNPTAKSKQSSWGSSLRPVHSFSTVEDFWRRGRDIRKRQYASLPMDDYDMLPFIFLGLGIKIFVEFGTLLIFGVGTQNPLQCLYNNIHHLSKLAVGADFYCFKHKIEPKWEDPICANGGKWSLNFSRGKSDTPWLYTLLAMIGEQFDHGEEICGAVVNIRNKQERVGIWTKNAEHEVAQVSIGRQWKEFLDFKDSIGFIVHDDAKKLARNANNRYTV